MDFSGKYPMFRIRAEAEKGHKDRLLPMAPEFAEVLDATPQGERDGFVFNPMAVRPGKGRLAMDAVSKILCDIGRVANVKVAESMNGKVKYASAHDCRRAFGFRWSQQFMPAVLQQMMRHEDIQTRMAFYVERNSEAAAAAIGSALANVMANISPKQGLNRAEENPANSFKSRG